MPNIELDIAADVLDFVAERDISLEEDAVYLSKLVEPEAKGLVRLELGVDPESRNEWPVRGLGVNYLFSQINYRLSGGLVAGMSRRIATIAPGERIPLMYIPAYAPGAGLKVHRGTGSLVRVSGSQPNTLDEYPLPLGDEGFDRDPITLYPDSFYTVEGGDQPLIVSSLHNLDTIRPGSTPEEIELQPGDHFVKDAKGRNISVPLVFWDRFKQDAL